MMKKKAAESDRARWEIYVFQRLFAPWRKVFTSIHSPLQLFSSQIARLSFFLMKSPAEGFISLNNTFPEGTFFQRKALMALILSAFNFTEAPEKCFYGSDIFFKNPHLLFNLHAMSGISTFHSLPPFSSRWNSSECNTSFCVALYDSIALFFP